MRHRELSLRVSELGLGLRESSRIKTLYIVRGNWASGQPGNRALGFHFLDLKLHFLFFFVLNLSGPMVFEL